jgi:hypothetical protein
MQLYILKQRWLIQYGVVSSAIASGWVAHAKELYYCQVRQPESCDFVPIGVAGPHRMSL